MIIFQITFYGTRGSTPVSGSEFLKYGGNTTCIAFQADDTLLILDCGTGILPLQKDLFQSGRFRSAQVFISHIHWDHIQGIAFFGSFFNPNCHFDLYGEARYGATLRQQVDGIMNSPMFPIEADAFGAEMNYHDFICGDTLHANGIRVETCRLDHPNICTGYRFYYQGKSICMVGDYEHGSDAPVEFAKGADVLIYDAQYTNQEYPAKKGWGHSTWEEACRFADQCNAKQLLLTHHDPARTDDMLDKLQILVEQRRPGTLFAQEGMVINV